MDQEPDIYDEPPPQQWTECPACDGQGYTVHRVTVYEHGCGFPHDDGEERKCERCSGFGGWIEDRQPDVSR
jgi:DnaJ-class molecular chaperone